MKLTLFPLFAAALLAPVVCVFGKAPDATTPGLQLSAELAHPRLPAAQKMSTYLKVGLTGVPFATEKERPPVNVAIVIDKSSSMAGDRIRHAREAAKQAIDLLSPEDIVSVIAYDSTVKVISSAAPLKNPAAVKAAIDQIESGGMTALFAGVSKASEELRKHKNPEQVSRVILLSDGMANVGPASTEELGRLGIALAKENVSVSTLGLGLGYNEDLMTELALRSDGNHTFIKDSQALASVFQTEFADLLSVVAQQMEVRIQCADGIRPVRVLGSEAQIDGQSVTFSLNQLCAKQQRSLLLEVEVPAGQGDQDVNIADVSVSYIDAASGSKQTASNRSVARRVDDPALVTNSTNKSVLEDVAVFIATEKEALAVKLNDEGRHAEAMKAYGDAVVWTAQQGKDLSSEKLIEINGGQMARQNLFKEGGANTNVARKMSKEAGLQNISGKSGASRKPQAVPAK